MESHYTQLSSAAFELKDLTSRSTETIRKDEGPPTSQKRHFYAWMSTVWSLVIHCLFSIGITLFVLVYMNHHTFHTTDRIASVRVIGGNMSLPFTPIQSDIVTILSSTLVVHRWALAAWATPLCWRVAMFLMEKRGLHHRDLRVLVDYRILTPRAFVGTVPTFIIGVLLLICLAANLASPILTGSISWIPKNQPMHGLLTEPIQLEDFEAGSNPGSGFTVFYNDTYNLRDGIAQRGSGLVGIGWGRDTDKRIYRRISSSVDALTIGTIVKDVTLPYFAIDSIEWIEDESNLPTYAQKHPLVVLQEAFQWAPVQPLGFPNGFAMLLPNLTHPTNWSSDPMNSITIEETRLLILSHITAMESPAHGLPPKTYIQNDGNGLYYSFAWVKLRAGAGQCEGYQCIIPSTSTIQNQAPIHLKPHPLTFQALSMAPVIAISLVNQNASIPLFLDDINDYVEAVLVRSYSGAWNSLNEHMSSLPLPGRAMVNLSYFPAVPTLVADVNEPRVYGWLGIQLLVTILGIVFHILQSYLAKFPLIGDTSLAAFYLDTTSITRSDSDDPFLNGTLRVGEEKDRLKLKVE